MQGSVSQGYFHFVKNVFGDVVGISDNGVLVARYEYDSWGNHRCVDANGNIITDFNHIGLINPFRWRSSYYDSETNLHYLAGRYYDPKLGVVLNPTLDEADAVGGYAHSAPNPFAVFGNTFADPTWGYPPLYDCECPPNEGCNYCGAVNSGGNWFTNWWNGLSGWQRALIGIGVIVGSVALAIATFGVSAKIKGAAAIAVGAGIKGKKLTMAVAISGGATKVTGGMAMGSGMSATGGFVFGGIGSDGWSWDGAWNGFAQGAITGALSGAAFGAGKVMTAGMTGWGLFGANFVINASANMLISAGAQTAFTGDINGWSVLSAGVFGGIGGMAAPFPIKSWQYFGIRGGSAVGRGIVNQFI